MSSSDTLMSKFSQALNSPIHNRCAELTVLIDRCSSKDLQHLFPTLMESIFGTSGGLSWGLHSIMPVNYPQDFETVHHFLGPLGPMFRLIYKILTDCSVKYEFSITHIPSKVRQILDNTNVPPFYADLLNIDTQTRKVHSLLLNAFDYYMFHFAHYLTNPWQQRNVNVWHTWNTVYYVLSCDYLIHFLPTNQNVVILPQLTHFTGKNPIIITPQSVTNRPQRSSKLFQTHVLQQTSGDMSTLHPPLQHPRGEIWRSESVVQIFIDIWLNNDQLTSVDGTFHSPLRVSELPSGEYIRILRVLVKQLHAFSASGRHDTTPLGELKKIVQPMLNGRMYAFLRHLVFRWPLDGSFRLVLELWLSFVQPWRYADEASASCGDPAAEEPAARLVEPHHLPFISDNLLAYTVIFQQLLPRFSRIDLASPKNALMLYRVCKVFAQPGLVPMLRQVESCVENLSHSPTHALHGAHSPTLPPLSPTSCWSSNTPIGAAGPSVPAPGPVPSSPGPAPAAPAGGPLGTRWAALVRHRIYEWEGPEFCYKPMFTGRPAPEVLQLLRHARQCQATAEEAARRRQATGDARGRGLLALLGLLPDDGPADEFSLDDRRKAPVYLSCARLHLADVFQLDEPQEVSGLPELRDDPAGPADPADQSDPVIAPLPSPPRLDLSPAGCRARARLLRYDGDPDLHPVRSWESGVLVRLLYRVARRLNERHGADLQRLWARSGLAGRLARQLLAAPQLVHGYERGAAGCSARVARLLPARLSLRTLASRRLLAALLLGLALFRLLGYGAVRFLATAALCWAFAVLLQALLAPDPAAHHLSRSEPF